MKAAFSISASLTSCWMTRLSESSQNKTAHRDSLMVGSFLVREELVRLVVLVEIDKLVRPAVENVLGFPCGIVVQRNGLAHIQHKTVHFRPHKKRQYTVLRALLSGTSLQLLDFNVWRSAIFSDQISFTNIFGRPCGKFADAI